ncbi:hypothetical protein HZS_359, partial [Henneguya salminicola]
MLRKQAIETVEAGEKKAKVAAKFGMAASTLSTILKDCKKICEKSKCLSIRPFNSTFAWQASIQLKALTFARMLANDDFLDCNGWLQGFQCWYKISRRAICGEKIIVPFDKLDEWLTGEIYTIISQFADDDIYNADEIDLFYPILPHRTLPIAGNRCREFIDIDKELDICHELTDSEIVENINQKSIEQVENYEFERDDEKELVSCNSISSNIELHQDIDQTRKTPDLVCKFDDTSG